MCGPVPASTDATGAVKENRGENGEEASMAVPEEIEPAGDGELGSAPGVSSDVVRPRSVRDCQRLARPSSNERRQQAGMRNRMRRRPPAAGREHPRIGDDAVAGVLRDDDGGPWRSPALRSAAARVPGAENP